MPKKQLKLVQMSSHYDDILLTTVFVGLDEHGRLWKLYNNDDREWVRLTADTDIYVCPDCGEEKHEPAQYMNVDAPVGLITCCENSFHRDEEIPEDENASRIGTFRGEEAWKNLREWRRAQGKSLDYIAKATGLSVSHISGVEHGKGEISVANLSRWLAALGKLDRLKELVE